jgi:hypothetical protein
LSLCEIFLFVAIRLVLVSSIFWSERAVGIIYSSPGAHRFTRRRSAYA